MRAETLLWADVYDAHWNRLGDGPVPLTSASVTRAFDGAGSISFEAPATDERVITLLKDQRRVKLWYLDPQTNVARQVGSGSISQRGFKYSAGGSQKSFSGPDVLDELVNYIALPNTVFSNQGVAEVASALAVRAGWQAETESGLDANRISARYDGASLLKALRAMTEKLGAHLREKLDVPSDRDHVIEIGRFGSDINLWIQNGTAFTSRVFDNTETAFIDSLTLTYQSEDIVNWVIPMGSGEGESALTLEKAARSATYPRETLVNGGKALYFKRNEASIARFGIRQKLLTFKDIAPIGNSDSSMGYAADALDEATDAFLERAGEPQVVYRFSIRKASKTIRPGDLVHLSFRGLVRTLDNQEIADETVEGAFYVLKVTESFSGSGVSLSLEVSNLDKLPQSAASYILSAIEDLQVQNVRPALTNFRESYSGDRVVQQWDGQPNYMKYATFLLPIDETVTAVTSVFLRFWSLPIYSYTAAGLGGVSPSQWVFNFFVVNDFLLSISPQVFKYPQDISLYINGQNVSAALGGPWNPAPNNNPVNGQFLDITDYIRDATGGIHQTHTIEFRVSTQTREILMLGYGGGTASWTGVFGNQGVIRAAITLQGTSQSVRSIH